MTRYRPPDDKRRFEERRLSFRNFKNDKLDFPEVKKEPSRLGAYLVNSLISFIVNIASTFFYPAVIAAFVTVVAIVKTWFFSR